MIEPGASDADRFLDIELPHSFRGLDPEAVQELLTDAVGALREAHGREVELRTVVAALEAELAEARADATAELEEAKRRGRQMVTEAQTVRRRILEDLVRRRKVLRRQIEQLRVGRERLLEAYEVVGLTVEEATAELGVALPAAQAAAERAGRRLGPDADEVTPEELHAIEAEIDAARVAGLPILEPPTAAERAATPADGAAEEIPDDEAVPPLVEVEPTLAAFEEMRVLGPADDEPEPEPEPERSRARAGAQMRSRSRRSRSRCRSRRPDAEPEAGAGARGGAGIGCRARTGSGARARSGAGARSRGRSRVRADGGRGAHAAALPTSAGR